MTLEAAARAADGDAAGEDDGGQVLMRISRATILGARGNSGVIFSQYLRGLARRLATTAGDEPGEAMAAALEAAADGAYGAVDEPVEGTILTVARRAAVAARAVAPASNPAAVLRAAAAEAGRAVEDTTEQLAELRAANVVDSAGLGLFHILEALAEVAEGHLGRPEGEEAPATVAVGAPDGLDAAVYGYEVQFVLEGKALDAAGLRASLHRLGESLVVAGDDLLLKVHIHTPDPEAVLLAARHFGQPEAVTIENLDAQTHALKAHPGETVPTGPSAARAEAQATDGGDRR